MTINQQHDFWWQTIVKHDLAAVFAPHFPAVNITPRISTGDDGEVCFWSCGDDWLLDLGVSDDGETYSYYAKLPDGSEVIKDETLMPTPTPAIYEERS